MSRQTISSMDSTLADRQHRLDGRDDLVVHLHVHLRPGRDDEQAGHIRRASAIRVPVRTPNRFAS